MYYFQYFYLSLYYRMNSTSNKKTLFKKFKTFLKKYNFLRKKKKNTVHYTKKSSSPKSTSNKSNTSSSNKSSDIPVYKISPPPSAPILAKYIKLPREQSLKSSRKYSKSSSNSPKSSPKSSPRHSPVYSSKNKLFNNLVLFYAKLFAKKLPEYVIFTQNEDSYTFTLTSNTGIQKNIKFKNLDDFLTSFHKIITLFITTCKIPFLCRPKTIKLLKNINDIYLNYYNNPSDLYNIYNLIINIYTLINRIALENLHKKDKKFVFINKCRLLLEIYLPESNVKSDDL